MKVNYPDKPLLNFDYLPFPKIATGKVREVFDLGDSYLMVASDRISAFDVVFNEGLCGKGILLTQLSLFWFEKIGQFVRHHLVEDHDERVEALVSKCPELAGRIMIVKKLKPLKIEAIVRGYLAGSAWMDYSKTQSILGYDLPNNLRESSQLPRPLFTPTTKAQTGHDIPISLKKAGEIVGEATLERVKGLSLEIFNFASKKAEKRGLILADTKFEFGLDDAGELYLIDEILTPDSSRYWFKDSYVEGVGQDPVDKQFIRNYLNTLEWDKKPPAPKLPDSVLSETLARYEKAYACITNEQ